MLTLSIKWIYVEQLACELTAVGCLCVCVGLTNGTCWTMATQPSGGKHEYQTIPLRREKAVPLSTKSSLRLQIYCV